MTDLVKLEMCPFCTQKEDLLVEDELKKLFWVECIECGCSGPYATTEAEAILKWNSRYSLYIGGET